MSIGGGDERAQAGMTDEEFVRLRDRLVLALTHSYAIPLEMRPAVRQAIREHQNTPYSDEALTRLVERPQSAPTTFRILSDRLHSLDNWGGLIDEYLACFEYNSWKNRGNVLTIINPDPTSKADLLHVVRHEHGFRCVAGPDCKSGRPSYLLDSWERNLDSKSGIPMIDMEGTLSDRAQLTSAQRKRLEALCERNPRRRPVASRFSPMQRRRLRIDLLNHVRTGKLPTDFGDEKPSVPTTGEAFAPFRAELRQKAENLRQIAPEEAWRRLCDVSQSDAALPAAAREMKRPDAAPASSEGTDPKSESKGQSPRVEGWFGRRARELIENVDWESVRRAAWETTKGVAITVGPVLVAVAFRRWAGRMRTSGVRSAPGLHTVSGHGQRYHTTAGTIWRAIAPYIRGTGSKV